MNTIPATKELYTFEGKIDMKDENGEQIEASDLTLQQFLHKGAIIKNSERILALVTYTGVQSKLILNLGSYHFKMSRLEKKLNYVLVFNVLVMFLLATVLTLCNHSFNKAYFNEYTYIFESNEANPVTARELTFKVFFSFYLILNSYVPLDLVLCLEIAKMLYTPFM